MSPDTHIGPPSSFDEIVGHARALETLVRSFDSGRGHHAWLLDGPAGVGKRTAARILGRSLLCARGAVGRPCNQCGQCRRVLAGSHPDWIELDPEAGSIKIADIRRLTSTFALRPFEGGRRVALIEAAERMTEEASNALLKTLEEPPAASYFLLITSNRAQLLPTIVSRCQHLAFSPLAAGEVDQILTRLGVASSASASSYSGGSPGRALTLLDEPAFQRRDELFGAFLRLVRGETASALDFGDWSEPAERPKGAAGPLAKKREQTRLVLELLKTLLRDLMVLRSGIGADHLINKDLSEPLGEVPRHLTWEGLSAMLESLREAERAVEGNVTPRLVLENLAVRVALASRRFDRRP